MSAERMPSRSEVMGWGPQQLADYLKKMKLSGCDKVVLKNCISGSRFVNLSDNDLQKFPKLHAPLISKLSTEISRKEERRGLFSKKTTPKYHEPEMAADVQVWGDDEFDEEFDDDYESPCSGDDEDSIGDYETPSDDVANDYEPPPSEPPEDYKQRPTLPIGDSEYIDSRNNHAQCPPPVVSPRPPVSTLSTPSPQRVGDSRSSRRDASPRSSARPAGNFPLEPPQVFRHNKPGQTVKSSPSPSRGLHNNTLDRPSARSWKSQSDATDHSTWPKPSLPPTSNFSAKVPPKPDMNREQPTFDGAVKHNTYPLPVKGNFLGPGRPAPPSCQGNSLPPNMSAPGSLSHKLQTAVAEQKGGYGGPPERQSFRPSPSATSCTQELNPCWYVGKVTRGQAEGCLKQVHKDGAYLVRDSTRQLPSQPFTLMVFYQDKVYNIQIRQENQQFQLGTGLKLQEFFSSVGDIISHYSQSPLLLIDAKNRSSSQQNQCLLSDPAGYYMTGQKWT